jgi:histidinol-phosphate aminotransferase
MRARQEDAIVLIDEAYFPYHGETVIDLTKKFENLIVTRTFSKAFGLASLRLGFAVAQPDLIRPLKVFKPMYETNGFAILFGCELLDHPLWVEENVKKTIEGREYLVKQMKGIGLYTYPSFANFVNIRVGHDHVGSLVKYMRNNGILIKPGPDHPALRDCIRISTGPVPKMKKVEKHIKFYFKSISRL